MNCLSLILLLSASAALAGNTPPPSDAVTPSDAATPSDASAEEAGAEVSTAPTSSAPSTLAAPVQWKLDDGTAVFLVEDHRVPLVELRIQVPVGYFNPWFMENGGQEAFMNQYYDKEGTLRARADALAADVAFAVKEQRTLMKVRCLKRDLPAVVELVKDILNNTDYDPAELDRDQKGRDLDWKTALKEPDSRLGIAVTKALYAEGDARTVNSSELPAVVTDIDRLIATRDTMLRMPGRALGFGGDLTQAEAEVLAEGLFPEIAAALPDDMTPVLHDLNDRPPTLTESMEGLNQVYFAWFRESRPWDATDAAASRVATHVLGGHFYSRLNVALRHEGGETYGANASAGESAEHREYIISTYTRVDNRDATEARLREVVETFRADGITQQELDDTLGYMRGRLLFDQQAPASLLDDAIWEHGNQQMPGHSAAQVAEAEALTLEEVNAFIHEFYDPSAFTMLMLEPAE